MKIVIDDDFLGHCATCRKTKAEVESGAPWQPREATTKIWVDFEKSIPATERFSEVKGIWCFVCDECAAERGMA